VSIAPTSTRQVSQTVVTEDDGRFIFESLPAGKYILGASRRGFGAQNYQQHQAYSTAIALGAGKKSDEIIFRLTPAGTITGIVSDESGDPVRDARVILFAHGSIGNGTPEIYNRVDATTDDEGRYRFSHVDPGKYYIGVQARVWYSADGVVNLHR
jgi:protocatechuate 3,4-dioxygenase beta subunit